MPLVDRKLQLENDIKKYLRKRVGERKLENSSSNADILTGAFNKPTLATAVISQLDKLNEAIQKGAMSCRIECPAPNLLQSFEKYWVGKGYIVAYTDQQKTEMFISWFGGAIWRRNWLSGLPKELHAATALYRFMADTVGDIQYLPQEDRRSYYSSLRRWGVTSEKDESNVGIGVRFATEVKDWIWISPKFGRVFHTEDENLMMQWNQKKFDRSLLGKSQLLLK